MINISLNVQQNCHKKTSNLPKANNQYQNEDKPSNFQTGSIQIDSGEKIDPTETLINNLNKEFLHLCDFLINKNDYLDNLNDIKNSLERSVTVIYGESGTGKLTLALKAAHRHLNQNKKTIVRVMNASNASHLKYDIARNQCT